MQAVCEKHTKGWPKKKKSLDRKLHGYSPVKGNVSIENEKILVRETEIKTNNPVVNLYLAGGEHSIYMKCI